MRVVFSKNSQKDNQPYMMRGSVNQTLKDSFPFSQFCGLRYQARTKTFLISAHQPIIKIGILTQLSSLLSFIVFPLALNWQKALGLDLYPQNRYHLRRVRSGVFVFFSLSLMSLWRSNDDFQQHNQNNDLQ